MSEKLAGNAVDSAATLGQDRADSAGGMMNQNDQTTFQVLTALSTVTLAFKYTLGEYAKHAGAAKIEEVAEVLRTSVRNAEPTPGVPDAVYTAAVSTSLAALEEMIKEVRRAVGTS